MRNELGGVKTTLDLQKHKDRNPLFTCCTLYAERKWSTGQGRLAEKTILQEGFKDRMTLNKASKSATMLAIDFTEPEKGERISWVPTWTRSASNPQTWTVPLAISPVNWPTVENGDNSTLAS